MNRKRTKNAMLNVIVGFLLSTFIACQGNSKNTEKEETVETKDQSVEIDLTEFKGKGKTLALAVKKELGKNLLKAIEERGSTGAVEFCNSRAISITDSMSAALFASIRRISDKPRNLLNAANEEEENMLNQWKRDHYDGKELQPLLKNKGDVVVGYYPIVTNFLCMQCHGDTESQIESATLEKIKELYPEDNATNYKENQIRGAFVVEMEK